MAGRKKGQGKEKKGSIKVFREMESKHEEGKEDIMCAARGTTKCG